MTQRTDGPAPRTDRPASSSPEGAYLEQFGDFIVSMIQAFLRTGYYLGDHPESKKAKSGLHEKFCSLTRSAGEVTFLMKDEDDVKVLYLEGIQEHPIKLTALMIKGMADAYNPRFVQFMERKELISLSLKNRMSDEEFSKFIDVMSEPTLADMKGQASKDKFVASLKANNVFNLSFVFRDDFVTARPGVPWRANLALSRLKKDLKTAPVLQNIKQEDIPRVHREMMPDIVRPLGETDQIYAFLMNLDLAVCGGMTEDQGEEYVLASLREDPMLALADVFVKDASEEDKRFHGAVAAEKFPRVAAFLMLRLTGSPRPEAKAILETMFASGLVSMESLPADVRQRVVVLKQLTDFMEDREGQLRQLDMAAGVEKYAERAAILAKIVPGLIARERYDDVTSIVERLAAHAKERSDRAVIAKRSMEAIGAGPAFEDSAKAFLQASKEARTVIGRLFMAGGNGAVPALLHILERTDDMWKSKQAAEILVHIGQDAAISLIHEVEKSALKPTSMATIVRVLGEVTDETLGAAAVKAILPKADDAHPEVRREVLLTLSRLQPHAHFDRFAAKMGDPDVKVRRAALHALGRSGDSRALEKLKGIVARAEQAADEASWDLACTAIENIGALYQSWPQGRAEIAGCMPEIVDKVMPKRSLKSLFKAAMPVPAEVAMALVGAAGRVQGEQAQAVLERLAGHWSKTVTAAAAEALKARGVAKK